MGHIYQDTMIEVYTGEGLSVIAEGDFVITTRCKIVVTLSWQSFSRLLLVIKHKDLFFWIGLSNID